jgi:hypothetical protein
MDSSLERGGDCDDPLRHTPARGGDDTKPPETNKGPRELDAPARWIRDLAEENNTPSGASLSGKGEAVEWRQGPRAALDILAPVVLDPDILDPIVRVVLDGDALDLKNLDGVHEPPRQESGSSGTLARLPLARFTLAISILAAGVIAALFIVRALPARGTDGASGHALQANLAEPHVIGQIKAGVEARTHEGTKERPNLPLARLVLLRAPLGSAGEAIPLGLSLTEASQDVVLLLHGLPVGTTISTGIALEADNWLLSVSELRDAVIRPPPGFVGAIDLAAELRLADETVADRLSLRLTWLETPKTPKTTTVVAPPVDAGIQPRETSDARPPNPPLRRLDREEITNLLRRGEEFMAAGNLGPARLAFRRAAEAGDPEGAFRLATTYDPVLLGTRGVIGVVPDIAMARAWYEKAKEFGSASASMRLQVLASPAP